MARTSDEKGHERRSKRTSEEKSQEKREKRARKHSSVDQESRQEMNEFSRIQTEVSMTLAKQVLSMNKVKEKNVVLSPVSIHVILGYMAAGFGTSKSRDEILSYLKSKSSEEFNSLISELMTLVFADGSSRDGPRLSTANGMWIDQRLKLKEAFKQSVVDRAYKACINSVDFHNKADEVRREVNVWAEKETNGLINDFLAHGQVTPSTALIFANVVYFKGEWYQKFDASKTRYEEFFLLNGDVIQSPFITSNENQQISAFDGFKVLRLPYKQGNDNRKYSMYIYLPDSKDGLSTLVEKFCSETGFIEKHVPRWHVMVGDFRFPKFKISFKFEARKILKKLGMTSVFREPLTEIAEDVGVTKVVHKSFVEVNEEGTEAAAVTSMLWEQCSSGRPVNLTTVDFVADHPFLFVIREDTTEMVLFVGQVLNPQVKE